MSDCHYYANVKECEKGCRAPPHPDKLKELLSDEGEDLRDEPEHAIGYNDGSIFPPSSYPQGVPQRVMREAAQNQPRPRGKFKTLVVLVSFPDQKFQSPDDVVKKHFQEFFFGKGTTVTDYYKEVSAGMVEFEGDVIGPYQLPHNVTHYANNDNGYNTADPLPNESTGSTRTMASDALDLVVKDKGSEFLEKYDNKLRAEGYVDGFIVVHSGKGGEDPGSVKAKDIWSVKWTLPKNQERKFGKTTVHTFATIPETAQLGVCVHEIGHLVFGWPDLYNPKKDSRGIGNWCLMAQGSWNGEGKKPAHPSAWCKAQQGWVELRTAKGSGSIVINEVKGTPDKTQNANRYGSVYRLWANGDTLSQEYFLIESRMKYGFDAGIPGEGLLVWHIDDAVQNQNDPNHYKVTLMNADAKSVGAFADIKVTGTDGNPFPGTTKNRSFTPTTVPSSISHTKQNTYVTLTNISDAGRTMKMDFNVTGVAKPT